MVEEIQQKELKLKFLYIGNDLVFWKKFQDRVLTQYEQKKPVFTQFKNDEDFSPYSFFHKIYHETYSVVFLDFSFQEEKMLELASLLRSETKTKLVSTAGIHDRLTSEELIARVLLAGIRLNYYKGEEIDAMVFQVVHYWKPSFAIVPKFSTANIEKPSVLIQDLRVVSFDTEAFGIETNSPLTDGDIVNVRRVLPSKVQRQGFIVRGVKDFDLHYNTRFGAQITPMLEPEDEDNIPEGTEAALADPEAEEVTEKEKRVITPEEIEEFLKLWTPDNLRVISVDEYRKIGIIIVDQNLEIFTTEKFRFKHLPYRINFQGSLHSELFQITRNRPDLIAFSYDTDTNDYGVLKNIISKIKASDDYNPHLVVFNSTKPNDELSSFIDYDKVISDGGPLNWDLVLKMASVLNDKANDPPEGISYVHGDKPGNVLQIELDIKIIRIDENELYFETFNNIPMYTVFHLNVPVKMLLTVIPIAESHEFNSNPNTYRGLINLVSDENAQNLRVEIKEFMFKEKRALKAQDKEEQDRIKEEYKKKKEEAEKAAAAKKAAEEAAENEENQKDQPEIVQGDPDKKS